MYTYMGLMVSVLEIVVVFLTWTEGRNWENSQIRDDISREKPMPFGGVYRRLNKKSRFWGSQRRMHGFLLGIAFGAVLRVVPGTRAFGDRSHHPPYSPSTLVGQR